MDENNKFAHDRTRYDRPDFPYRCGRGVLWLKPCHQGPTINGLCGGKTECSPFLDEEHWVCNRPLIAGGPCEEGPNLDGSCCKRHPPCVPKYSLRAYRKRLAILAVGCIIALIGVSWMADQLQRNYFSYNPGPLSSSHIKFAEKDGCQTCHESHRESPFNWLKAVAIPVNLSSKCEDCHMFGGSETIAHNGDIEEFPRLQETHCLMCHREHKGEILTTRTFTSQQCNHCHEKQFESFSSGHPEFSTDYPYARRDSINFNHITHLKKYFLEPKHKSKSPEGCVGCHNLFNDQDMQTGKFEVICAACHKSQILAKDLVLVRLPELDKDRISRRKIRQACGPISRDRETQKDGEDFLSISTDTPSLTTAYLLNIPDDDPERYSETLQDLIMAMAKDSAMPIAKLIDKHSPKPIAEKMLAGLNPEVIKRAACAWGLNIEYDPPAKPNFGGWHADLLEVRYKPVDHKDPVALSWIKFALDVPSSETDEMKRKRAIAMRDQMLSPKKGVGGCTKCHVIQTGSGEHGKNNPSILWGYLKLKNIPYVKFAHKSHLDVLGKGKACETCHILNKEIKVKASTDDPKSKGLLGNFTSINRNTCMECHNKGKVRQECQLCHLYHLEPAIKGKILLAENQPK